MWLELLIDKIATASERLKEENESPLATKDVPLTRGDMQAILAALNAALAIRNLVR